MSFISKNPFTQEVYAEFPFTSRAELAVTLENSYSEFVSYSNLSFDQRGEKVRALATALRHHKDELALAMSQEMGKPLSQSTAEVLKCADCCDYYAEHASRLLSPTPYSVPGSHCYIRYEPLGPVFSILPFNFPLWMPIKTAVPLLMAGNTFVLKPPENTPRLALRLAELATQAGLSFKVVFLRRDDIEEAISSSFVRGVTITGSIGAGRVVGGYAAKHLKKCVLELGGSDPFIVLGDAELSYTVQTIVTTRLMGCGQVCISPKRILVDETIYDQVVEKIVAEVADVQITDPTAMECRVGPMAREDLVNIAKSQIDRSVAMGAKLLCGGSIEGPCLFKPAVLSEVTQDMPVAKEETFAPIFVLMRCSDEEEAILIANNTEFGLGAAVFTTDSGRVEAEVVPRLEAGMVFVNDFVKSIVPVPFGGTKSSGLGRELGEPGIKEFTNPKTVVIKNSST